MKTLKSKCIIWNHKDVIEMPLKDLFQSIRQDTPFTERVKADIQVNGLTYPLIIVESTWDQYYEEYKKFSDQLLLPEETSDWLYIIYGGSQRYAIAQEFGYTHIDCVIYKNGAFRDAWKAQKLQRAKYIHLYN